MEQESKRAKRNFPNVKIEISVFFEHAKIEGDFQQFVDKDRLMQYAGEQIARQKEKAEREEDEREKRILNLARVAIPSATAICWEEYGAIEEVGYSQYFEGPRSEVYSEFDTDYLLNFDIRIPSTEEEDDDSQGVSLSFSATIDLQPGDDKVYPEYSDYKFSLDIIWCDKGPFPANVDKLEEVLLSIIETEVAEPMCGIIKDEIKQRYIRELAIKKENK